jgi:hypothetical protein
MAAGRRVASCPQRTLERVPTGPQRARPTTRHTIVPVQHANRDLKAASVAIKNPSASDRLASRHDASPDQAHGTRSHLLNGTISSPMSLRFAPGIISCSSSLSSAQRNRRFSSSVPPRLGQDCCGLGRSVSDGQGSCDSGHLARSRPVAGRPRQVVTEHADGCFGEQQLSLATRLGRCRDRFLTGRRALLSNRQRSSIEVDIAPPDTVSEGTAQHRCESFTELTASGLPSRWP